MSTNANEAAGAAATNQAGQVEVGGMMSLADIAGLDVSDVEELRSSQFPVGLFTWEVAIAKLDTQTVKDDELRYTGIIELKCVEVDTLTDRDATPDDCLGKTFTEKFFIDPAEAQKGIGFLKGFVADVGCDNKGNMGGVEGAPPGYLDKMVGHRFKAKIIKKKGKDGEFYSRLQLIKKSKGS